MMILVTGSSGFFGWNAVRYFNRRGNDVVATSRSLPHYLHQICDRPPVALDLADGPAIGDVVARFQPDFILHAAAIARPQRATHTDDLYRINVTATELLAKAAASVGAGIVYISTDLVYPSDAGEVNEESPVDPSGANEYSRTKYLGEEAIRSVAHRWLILRSSLMFGDGPQGTNSFSMFIDGKWAAGEPAPLFIDQFRSFLYVGDLCTGVDSAVRAGEWNQVYVCGGDERLSRAEFGIRYAGAAGVDRSMIRQMRSTELEGYVGGPSDITLDCRKLRSTGWRARPLEECFSEMVRERKPA